MNYEIAKSISMERTKRVVAPLAVMGALGGAGLAGAKEANDVTDNLRNHCLDMAEEQPDSVRLEVRSTQLAYIELEQPDMGECNNILKRKTILKLKNGSSTVSDARIRGNDGGTYKEKIDLFGNEVECGDKLVVTGKNRARADKDAGNSFPIHTESDKFKSNSARVDC